MNVLSKFKKPAILFLIFSVIGFIYSTSLKNRKQIYVKKTFDHEIHSEKLSVQKGNEYLFVFSAMDEESEGFAPWPYAEAVIIVENDNGKILIEDTLADGGYINVGVKRALANKEYRIKATDFGELTHKWQLVEGMECELIIYKNIEDWRNMLPAFFILTFIIGVFWVLRKKQK